MNEQQFWALIERAWRAAAPYAELREALVAGDLAEEDADQLEDAAELVVDALDSELDQLSADELMAFDRVLERKLYDIDREDVHEYADGSDDGFLYERGFIVAMGQAYYDAVNADPSTAVADCECERMCYLSRHLYEEKFGEMPASGISRETGSNTAGWPT